MFARNDIINQVLPVDNGIFKLPAIRRITNITNMLKSKCPNISSEVFTDR
jgi:hypothetical protein